MTDYFDTPNLEHKMKKYPCYTCLVRAACTEYINCELITKNKKNMFYWISIGICPDCGQKTVKKHKMHVFKCSTCNHTFEQYSGEIMERI